MPVPVERGNAAFRPAAQDPRENCPSAAVFPVLTGRC